MELTHLEYLEEILNSKDACDHLTGYQKMVIDALTELLSYCPYERLCELVQADKEGRCVVLPCKIGDIVYEIRYTAESNSPRKHARKRFDYSVSACTWRMRQQPDMCYVSEKKCTKSDFAFMGRTVFLTRADADAALRREQDG